MDLVQFYIFFLLPIIMALYALYNSKGFKIEIFILAYVFAHSSSGLILFEYSLSFEKVMSLILFFILIFKYRINYKETRKIISIWLIFFIYSSLVAIFNGKGGSVILIFFDILQILVLPLFLFNYLKNTNTSIRKIALGFYRVGILILLIQLVEIYFGQDFYQLTNLGGGFRNYIGSIERNNILRASSLFSEVSIAALYSLIGLLLSLNFFDRFLRIKAVFLFLLIIILSATRLGFGLFLFIIFIYYSKIYKYNLIKVIIILTPGFIFSSFSLEYILDFVSSISNSGSEIAFADSDKDSSLYEREMQLSYLFDFLNSKNVFFGFGRSRLLGFIASFDLFNTLDSRIIMQILFNGVIGLVIYLIGILRIIKFKTKTAANRLFRNQLILLCLPFMMFSSVAEIFYLIGLVLPFLYIENYNSNFIKG